MGESSLPPLRGPAPGAAAPSPTATATPTPRPRHLLQTVAVQSLPFCRDSSRTQRHALPLAKQFLGFDPSRAGNYAGSLAAAYRAQQQGFHNVVWLDGVERRFVEESGLMNIFFVIDGVAVTPALSGTILPGIVRDTVLVLLREMGIETAERPIPIDEVFSAHSMGTLAEAFGVGTAATVTPIE